MIICSGKIQFTINGNYIIIIWLFMMVTKIIYDNERFEWHFNDNGPYVGNGNGTVGLKFILEENHGAVPVMFSGNGGIISMCCSSLLIHPHRFFITSMGNNNDGRRKL